MCGWLSAASSCASRAKRAPPLRIGDEDVRQDLDRDVAIELRIAGAIDLAHSAGAERAEDLVRTEARAGAQRHCDP